MNNIQFDLLMNKLSEINNNLINNKQKESNKNINNDILLIRERFFNALEVRTGWGRYQIKDIFNEIIA